MNKKTIIAVITCHGLRNRADSQRNTWVPDVASTGMDIKFFLGSPSGRYEQRDDEVVLDVGDGYDDLPRKVALAIEWALQNGYETFVKMDDDVYLRPERLAGVLPSLGDYSGRLRGPSGNRPAPYCSGFLYILSERAMRSRASMTTYDDVAEDRTTGNHLRSIGINGEYLEGLVITSSGRNIICGTEGPREGNNVIASCEHDPISMENVHKEFLTKPSGSGRILMAPGTPYDRVDILVKTFLRDGMMFKCVDSILKNMPGARIVLVDDGVEGPGKTSLYRSLRDQGHVVRLMAFDSGYGAKNNEASSHYNRDFVLRASDDFLFTQDAAAGVLRMIDVMDSDLTIGIASGRLNNMPYECLLHETIREDGLKDVRSEMIHPSKEDLMVTRAGTEYAYCDFTVNYSLVRSNIMRKLIWDEKFKIGGDHMDIYLHCRDAMGMRTAWVKDVNITSIDPFPGSSHPRYGSYRGRARLALPHTFDRLGWATFVDLDGRVDTRESVQEWADAHRHLENIPLKYPGNGTSRVRPTYRKP